MKIPETIKPWLQFSRKERIGISTLFLLIALIWFSPKLLPVLKKADQARADTAWIRQVKNLEKPGKEDHPYQAGDYLNDPFLSPAEPDDRKIPKNRLFYFDPNTLGMEEWKQLGIPSKTIQTIHNYLGKGGHFYTPGDLRRIYGLTQHDYERLQPFIRIEPPLEQAASTGGIPAETFPARKYPVPSKAYPVIDINTADTSLFITLPGIGSRLALRIVTFREKLGGFYSVNQVGETYGLADSVFSRLKQYLTAGTPGIRKLNVNTASKEELAAHPYIKWKLANAIVEYRNQHGNFTSIEELKNISLLEEPVFEKLRAYVSAQ